MRYRAIGIITLCFMCGCGLQEKTKAKEIAQSKNIELSGERVNLSKYVGKDFSGRLNITYEQEIQSELSNGVIGLPAFIEGHWVFGKDEVPYENCQNSSPSVEDFWIFPSKYRVNPNGRAYTSFFKGKGKEFFVNRNIIFDEKGNLYVSPKRFEDVMVELCDDYFEKSFIR